MIKASIIIPCKDRQKLMERAVKSIISLDVKNITEIIIIDDGSLNKLERPTIMRDWDQLIRLPKNMGGAVSRNIGISNSKGEIIYLLDSDDYFIECDFENDLDKIKKNHIYYGDVVLRSVQSKFPDEIEAKNYLSYIFNKYPYITQTSTLCFHKETMLKFDESLPKHQDWDLIYYALKENIKLVKNENLTWIDIDDKFSISRNFNLDKSEVWKSKILKDDSISDFDKFYIFVNTNGITNKLNINLFLKGILALYLKKELSIKFIILLLIKRYSFTRNFYVFFKKIFLLK